MKVDLYVEDTGADVIAEMSTALAIGAVVFKHEGIIIDFTDLYRMRTLIGHWRIHYTNC